MPFFSATENIRQCCGQRDLTDHYRKYEKASTDHYRKYVRRLALGIYLISDKSHTAISQVAFLSHNAPSEKVEEF